MKIESKRDFVLAIKKVYDDGGVDACGELCSSIIKKGSEKTTAFLIDLIITLVYKIDTCTSTCFDNLQEKKLCSCLCNDEEITILLDSGAVGRS